MLRLKRPANTEVAIPSVFHNNKKKKLSELSVSPGPNVQRNLTRPLFTLYLMHAMLPVFTRECYSCWYRCVRVWHVQREGDISKSSGTMSPRPDVTRPSRTLACALSSPLIRKWASVSVGQSVKCGSYNIMYISGVWPIRIFYDSFLFFLPSFFTLSVLVLLLPLVIQLLPCSMLHEAIAME